MAGSKHMYKTSNVEAAVKVAKNSGQTVDFELLAYRLADANKEVAFLKKDLVSSGACTVKVMNSQ